MDKKPKRRENIRIIAGWLVLALGIYLLITFVSYLFTWTVDQSLLSRDNILISEIDAANKGGLIGVRWSHLFIGKLFGISAFIIPLFLIGFSIFLMRIRQVKIVPLFFVTAFACIILSITLGYIFSFTSLQYVFGSGVGGTYGYRVNEWLISMLGIVGTGLLLFFVLTAFPLPFIVHRIRKRKQKQTQDLQQEDESPTKTEVPVSKDLPVQEIDLESSPRVPAITVAGTGKAEPAFEIELTEEESTSGKMLFYDPKQDLSRYKKPSLELLEYYEDRITEVPQEELERNNQKIVECLRTFDIQIEKIVATPGPTVTLYKIVLSPGIRISQFTRLEDDIMLSLAARGMRVIAPIPGTNMVGIEVANDKPSLVPMRSVLETKKYK